MAPRPLAQTMSVHGMANLKLKARLSAADDVAQLVHLGDLEVDELQRQEG